MGVLEATNVIKAFENANTTIIGMNGDRLSIEAKTNMLNAIVGYIEKCISYIENNMKASENTAESLETSESIVKSPEKKIKDILNELRAELHGLPIPEQNNKSKNKANKKKRGTNPAEAEKTAVEKEIAEKINKALLHIAPLNEAIKAFSLENKIKDKINNEIQELIPKIKTFDELNTLLSIYTPEEIKDIVSKFSSDTYDSNQFASLELQIQDKKPHDIKALNPKIFLSYVNQEKLNGQLNNIISSYNSNNNCQRIIITTSEVLFALKRINSWCEKNLSLNDLINSTTPVTEIFPELEKSKPAPQDSAHQDSTPQDSTPQDSAHQDSAHQDSAPQDSAPQDSAHQDSAPPNSAASIEIAWGLLDSLKRHGGDNIFITTSFYLAKEKIPNLAENSTLVIDGHGGQKSLSCAEYKKLDDKGISTLIKDLLSVDTQKHIKHFILQSCKSGGINEALSEDNVIIKKSDIVGKRAVEINTAIVPSNQIFSDEKSNSAVVFKTLQEANRDDIAFTFNSNLINPSTTLGGGNVGINPDALDKDKKDWPQNVQRNDAKLNDDQPNDDKPNDVNRSDEAKTHNKRYTLFSDPDTYNQLKEKNKERKDKKDSVEPTSSSSSRPT